MKAQRREDWDALLKIRTSGRDDSIADQNNYPYEPTPYEVLNRLAGEGYIRKQNCVLDYGCGKGRVDFFLAYQVRCRCIGLDYDERMIEAARENQKRAVSGERTEFIHGNAANYIVPERVDCCYFFNPFSLAVLEGTLCRIRESYYQHPRTIQLFFYYPSDEYVARLMQEEELSFVDEISVAELFSENLQREKILIFAYE